MKTLFPATMTVLPFLQAMVIAVAAMPTNVFQVCYGEMGHEHAQPWRSSALASVRRTGRILLARLRELCDGWRGHPLAMPAAVVAAALIVQAVLPSEAQGLGMAIVATGTAAELREQREKLIRDAGDLRGANNTFENDDKRAAFDKMLTDIEALGPQIEDAVRNERIEALSRTQFPESQRSDVRTEPEPGSRFRSAEEREVYEHALGLYLRGENMSDMSKEEREALRGGYVPLTADQKRDMSTLGGAAGGFLVAPDTRFYGRIIQAQKFFGGMESAGAEVIRTDTAGPMPIPMGDDTGNVGEIVGEAAASAHAGGTSPTVSQMVMGGYLYSSKVVKVSWQMIRDGAIDIEGYVGGLLGERLARIQNTHFTTRTGPGGPQGLMSTITVGRQSATGNTTSVPFDDVYQTIHSVDVAYRTPDAKWMFNDGSALTLRLAKDGNGRYLWPEMGSVQAGQPASLAGYGYVVNNDMAAMAASAKWASFGQHSHYKIRRVKGITVVRISELYVESGQVGFLAFESADGGYANPGQNPIKALQNSAS